MSWLPCENPQTKKPETACSVDVAIVPRARDLGGFEVRRVLPSARRRMVGPFIFLDQMGPADFPGGKGIDVRPHPHIGLATVTYLLQGTIRHRDSLGSCQLIAPGDVNWMTAGRGIVHSERSDERIRQDPETLYGLQLWVALPARHEETEPAFVHYEKARLPVLEDSGLRARVVAGSVFGATSPVETLSDLFFADVTLEPGGRLALAADYEERAAYLLEGPVEIEGVGFESGRLLVLAPDREVVIEAPAARAHLVLLGGAPLEGPRHIWWNFVSSRPERIEQAKRDWKRDRFGQPVPGDDEFIPLPEDTG